MKIPTDVTEHELRKRISASQHIIDVKKRELPKLREKLMWALLAQCSEGAQQKFMRIYEAKKEQYTNITLNDNESVIMNKHIEQLIALLERTIKEGSK